MIQFVRFTVPRCGAIANHVTGTASERKGHSIMAGKITRCCAVVLFLGVLGCEEPPGPQTETGDPRLKPFASADEMKQYIRNQMQSRSTYRGGFFGIAPVAAMAEDSSAPAADEFSTTNVQEDGVDESDRLKTDGEYLYIATDDRIRIVRAVPRDQMAQVSSIPVERVSALYLRGDRLVAISPRGYGGWYGDIGGFPGVVGVAEDAPGGGEFSSKTEVTIVSIADRAAPVIEATLDFDADFVSSRMIEDRLHLVMTTYPNLPAEPDEIPVRPLEEIIPDHSVTIAGQTVSSGDVAGWDAFLHPVDPDGVGMTIVASLDVTAPQDTLKTTAVLADAGQIYASTSALYVTDTAYTFWDGQRETTDIYKFDLTGESPAYVASGKVDGRVLNQFSMGEHEGHLRVATTKSGTFTFDGVASPSNNAVFVLGADGDTLKTVGSVEGIAPGETIYSARFIGDRGFLVTFVQIDPLFTLDLSDPANPTVVGSLKVPGYSDYIHPLGDDHLLTIGKDADDAGDFAWFGGVQLSVFDVTAFESPKLASKIILGTRGTESEALYEHKAFNYYEPLEMLAIPVHLFEGAPSGPEYGTPTFAGVYVYHVTPADGLDYRGRLSTDNAAFYGMGWTRTAFIGDVLYVVTTDGVQAALSNDLAAATTNLNFD
jgi:uncharacterized secreted protein with C-terminal beta-propeller domain